jgi:hypothetical protein
MRHTGIVGKLPSVIMPSNFNLSLAVPKSLPNGSLQTSATDIKPRDGVAHARCRPP